MITIILSYKLEKVVKNIFGEILASKFKENMHSVDIPFMRGRKALSQLSDFKDKIISKVMICGSMQSIKYF